MNSNVYLYCFMDSKQENLIYQFIQYYKSLGIPICNWRIILHAKQGCDSVIQLLKDNAINYEIVDEYKTDLKRAKVNEFINTIDDGWLVYPDLDEFFDFGQPLQSIINECNIKNIELVKGREVERFSKDWELLPINKTTDMFEMFPIKIDFSYIKHEISHENVNVMLVRITPTKKPKYINSHRLEQEETYTRHDKDYTLHHFRWSLYAIDCIRYKFLKYLQIRTDVQSVYYRTLFMMIKKNNDKYYIDIESQIIPH